MVNKLNLFVLGPEPEEGCGRSREESLDEQVSDVMGAGPGGGREDTLKLLLIIAGIDEEES